MRRVSSAAAERIACRKTRYATEVFGALPRLLNLLDREPTSPTFGSFDRDRWAWGARDFDNADLQRGVLPLAIAYASPWPRNPFEGNERILEWITAGLEYWARIQRRDGSFDQWYPGEASVGTTAFTLGSILETLDVVKSVLPAETRERVLHAAHRAGRFLLARREGHAFISNHRAGEAAALQALADHTGDGSFAARARALVESIASRQSPEGWFDEYGGADPGYETLGLSYLAAYYRRSVDAGVVSMAGRSIRFLMALAHPDGTVGGEYGSRNTELYFPAGLEVFGSTLPDAEQAAGFFVRGLARGVPAPSNADGQNFVPLLANYATAFHETPPGRPSAEGLRWDAAVADFPEAGIHVRRHAAYHAILGVSKGGVLKVFDPASGRLLLSDAGYFGILRSGRRVSSQMLDRGRRPRLGSGSVSLTTPFYVTADDVMTPVKSLALRTFALTLGRAPALGEALKRRLVGRLIARRARVPMTLQRTVTFADDAIAVEDALSLQGRVPLVRMTRLAKGRTVFMGSSRYWTARDLDLPTMEDVDSESLVRVRQLHVVRVLRLDDERETAPCGGPVA
jgi:hypothetical protein